MQVRVSQGNRPSFGRWAAPVAGPGAPGAGRACDVPVGPLLATYRTRWRLCPFRNIAFLRFPYMGDDLRGSPVSPGNTSFLDAILSRRHVGFVRDRITLREGLKGRQGGHTSGVSISDFIRAHWASHNARLMRGAMNPSEIPPPGGLAVGEALNLAAGGATNPLVGTGPALDPTPGRSTGWIDPDPAPTNAGQQD